MKRLARAKREKELKEQKKKENKEKNIKASESATAEQLPEKKEIEKEEETKESQVLDDDTDINGAINANEKGTSAFNNDEDYLDKHHQKHAPQTQTQAQVHSSSSTPVNATTANPTKKTPRQSNSQDQPEKSKKARIGEVETSTSVSNSIGTHPQPPPPPTGVHPDFDDERPPLDMSQWTVELQSTAESLENDTSTRNLRLAWLTFHRLLIIIQSLNESTMEHYHCSAAHYQILEKKTRDHLNNLQHVKHPLFDAGRLPQRGYESNQDILLQALCGRHEVLKYWFTVQNAVAQKHSLHVAKLKDNH